MYTPQPAPSSGQARYGITEKGATLAEDADMIGGIRMEIAAWLRDHGPSTASDLAKNMEYSFYEIERELRSMAQRKEVAAQ